MTKKDVKHFKSSTKCWTCDNVYVYGDVKVRNHFHVTGKYSHMEIVVSGLN